MESQLTGQQVRSNIKTYLYVFIALAIITAVEIFLSTTFLSGQVLTIVFIALSLAKASLIAAFFMHLRSDSRLYTYIFVLPAAMFILFAFLTVAA